MKKKQLTPAQKDALAIDKHICVTAGAGSGKTTVLVERYLKILREGDVTPKEIVAITFTEKAAAEMKERIIKELTPEKERKGSKQDNALQHFREEMGTVPISTIHAFCSRTLREFPFQAKVPANFSVLQGIDQKLRLQQTIKGTLKKIATNTDDDHRAELTRLLQRYGGQQKLVDFFANMINQRDLVERLMQEIYEEPDDGKIRRVLKQRVKALEQQRHAALIETMDIPEFIRCLEAVLHVAKGKNAEKVRDLLYGQDVKSPDPSEALKLLSKIAYLITTGSNTIAKRDFLGNRVKTTGIEDEINFLVSTAKKVKNVSLDDNETDDDYFLICTIRDLLTLYTRIAEAYSTTKLSQGELDFTDLQLKTRDLLRNDKEIRQKLVARYKYYMVDEYQDTNELQSELVMLLTDDLKAANLFIVGDPKQSIYGFRGADVRVFDKTKQKICENGGSAIELGENFRSLRDPVGFVNYFFERLMGDGKENEFEVEYEPLTKARPVTENGAVEMLLGNQEDESELIAHHIKNMKQNEEEVWDKDNNVKRPIEYGDIAILIRSRTHLPDIEDALRKEKIPYLTTGGIGFYQRQEIYDIWNYLDCLNRRADAPSSLFGVLRGPAFGISDAELYEISLKKGKDFWNKMENYDTPSDLLKNARETLKKHLEIAHRLPVNQLIVTIVNETGMIGTLRAGEYGKQRWANYQKLLELARNFARNFDSDESKQTLPEFIEFMDTLITEEPREGDAPVEADSGSVQIMTIHAAKGTEFPVVILPRLERQARTGREPFIDDELGIGFSPLRPKQGYQKTEPGILTHMKDRSHEKEIAEKKRLFYVGATRARDRLILSGSHPAKNMLGWLYEHLDIDEEDLDSAELKLQGEVDVFKENNTRSESFDLHIPIHQKLDAPAGEDEGSGEQVDFPETLPVFPEPTGTPAAFSVSELATYARCSLRYQLENVLRIPINGQDKPDVDENGIDTALRSTLARIRKQTDIETLDTTLEQALESYPELTLESKATLRTHINNFINSELGKTALAAAMSHTNQPIHAAINGHIVDGRIDRLFKDETGNYQIIHYKTDTAQNLETADPEIELYSLLVHRRYPNQPTVTINIFFTRHGRWEQIHFSKEQLQAVQAQWQEKILALQQGEYEKNLEHCCSCPYADPDGNCIITEA